MSWIDAWISVTLQRRPLALRSFLRVSQTLTPRLLRNKLVVTGAGVREVFDRAQDFQVGCTIAPKLKVGKFLLGMDVGPRHAQEKRALVRALDASFAAFGPIAASESDRAAQALAEQLTRGSSVELASELAERVYTRALGQYFGLPLDGWSSKYLDTAPGERTLALFIRTMGTTIGSKHPAPFGLEALADKIGNEFRAQLEAAVARHRDGSIGTAHSLQLSAADTVIGRLLQPSPLAGEPAADIRADAAAVATDGIERSIAGMLSAGAGFPKAFCHALHELLRQNKLGEVKPLLFPASNDLRSQAERDVLVQAYVLEALRFRPVFPLLARYCPRDTTLAGEEIAAGTAFGFSPLAAMFDPDEVTRPDVFIPGRPAHVYSIFGAGPRACIGAQLMLALFPPLLRALLQHVPGVLNAAPGTFRYDGAGLERYELQPADAPTIATAPPPKTRALKKTRKLSAPEPALATCPFATTHTVTEVPIEPAVQLEVTS
jgi:cytochrome P450